MQWRGRDRVRKTTVDMSDLDVQSIRNDFPILRRTVYDGKRLVFLDSAASAQKPQAVIDAVSRYYETTHSNIHRGAHALAAEATEAYEDARKKIARFVGAALPEEIVFVRGATEAINLVAQTYGRAGIEEGDEILITEMEHHANIVPWQMLCEDVGARLRVVPVNDKGEFVWDEFERLLGPRTKLVAVTHVSNTLGTINPVRDIIEAAHRQDVPVLIDGAQAVSHMRVDVSVLDCDFYVFSGHKLFGPTGIGVLYGKEHLLRAMPPYQGGGAMIRSVSFDKTTFEDPPYKFEAGTPNIAGAIGLGVAVDYVEKIGIGRIGEYEHELVTYGQEKLRAIDGLRLIGAADQHASILSFVVDGIHADDIGRIVDREGVAVRVGHHCTQPLMKRFGVPATVRASLAFYNTKEEIDVLVAAVRKAIHVMTRTCPIERAEVRPSTESIEQTQDRIISEFSAITDWEERYQKIIDLGRRHPHIPDEYKQDKFIVRGCQSTVWLHARAEKDGRVTFSAESNAMIVNGLITLLIRVYSGRTTDEIIETQPRFITEIGLSTHLSQARANGLAAMLEQIKNYALVLKTVAGAR
ncbi:MAG: SufS family cysteine desulfurase [Phycisphaerales bacterium]|nr:SufS family cysteine desulfurase [Phycisphaerales bacterium]MCB9864596.1 SufS family cysteine desulfurase [Phycisphaerales bacterium]